MTEPTADTEWNLEHHGVKFRLAIGKLADGRWDATLAFPGESGHRYAGTFDLWKQAYDKGVEAGNHVVETEPKWAGQRSES